MSTQNLLRPMQRQEMEDDKRALENNLKNPGIEDRGAVIKQIRTLDKQLEEQSPKPYDSKEIDKAVKREKELRESLLVGMPSQEEMRKAPPGAVGKHQEWEKNNKQKLLEWKHIRLRLNHDSNDQDIANFERYRPKTSSLNMDNAVIPGQTFFLAPDTPEFKNGYDNITWDSQKTASETGLTEKPKVESKKKGWTPERRAAASERMKAINAKKKAEKEAEGG